MERAM
jgi:hypothetical protein